MSWTTPRTYTDGELLTAAILNADIRDNLLATDQHAHTGAAGDGEQFLSSLDYADLDYSGALGDPAAGHLRFGANSGGTLRYRATGDTEKTVSAVGHTHVIAEITQGKTQPADVQTPNAGLSSMRNGSNHTSASAYANQQRETFTPVAGNSVAVTGTIIGASYDNGTESNGTSHTIFCRLLEGGSQQVEVSKAIAVTGAGDTGTLVIAQWTDEDVDGASKNYDSESKQTGSYPPGDFVRLGAAMVSTIEVGI